MNIHAHDWQVKDSPYLLQTLIEDVLVLPPKYLSELRMLPGSRLSASDALVVSILGQYSGVDVILNDRQTYDVTRVQLTKSLRKGSNTHSDGCSLTMPSKSPPSVVPEGRSTPFRSAQGMYCVW
jgi:hypothetical protein